MKFIWSILSRFSVFFLVIVFIIGAFILINFAYKPRGNDALKLQLEQKQKAIQELAAKTQGNPTTVSQQRKELDLQVQQLTRELEAKGVKVETGPQEVRYNVVVQPVVPSSIRDELALPATFEATSDIILSAKTDGTLEWVGPKEGARVKKGEVIAKVDAERFVQALNRAQAAEKLARVNKERIQNLVNEKVASQGELDRVISEWEQTKAAVSIAQKDLADSNLRAPIDGVLDDWMPDVGEFVNRGTALARIVDTTTVKAVVNVPEKDVSFFRIGQTAEIEKPQPLQGQTAGTIARIRLVADEQSKTFPMEIQVPNGEGIFRPGMINRAKLLRRDQKGAIVIPFFTVLQTQDGAQVFVENNGKAAARKITIGIRQGMMLEVTDGLKAGDRLIVSGQRNLSDGALVRVVEKMAEK